jgi:hypothetical protein
MMQQVFYNLSNFIDSDLAYAAQAVVSSGTATTSDTLGGSFSYDNWAYAPVADAFRARRLMALYRFAVTGDEESSGMITPRYTSLGPIQPAIA